MTTLKTLSTLADGRTGRNIGDIGRNTARWNGRGCDLKQLTAVTVVQGRSTNGRKDWKTAEGVTLKQLQTTDENNEDV